MKCVIALGIFAIVAISSILATDLMVGNTFNRRLIYQTRADYFGFPFKKRVKEVFFSDPGQQLIQGIIARDNKHSEGSATITAGGLGFSFVNLRLKSERGTGLDYLIEIYV